MVLTIERSIKKLSDEDRERMNKAKVELREYRDNIKYIREKGEDLTELRADLVATTTRLSPSKTSISSMSSDKFSDKIDRIDRIEKDRANQLEELLTKKFVIDQKIESMQYPHRDILFMRYARRKRWDEISKELDYTERRIHQLHGEALLIYAKL